MPNAWVVRQRDGFLALSGATIARADATEWTFFEDDILFDHPALPFLQLATLDLTLADGRAVRVLTYQNDTTFGLSIGHALPHPDVGPLGAAYRERTLEGLAGQTVAEVEVHLDEGEDVGEVRLRLASGATVILVAGEVEETPDPDTVVVRRRDESVLLFWSEADLAAVPFDSPLALRSA